MASVGTEDDQPTKKMKRPLSNAKSANWAAVKTAVKSGVYDSKNDGMNGRLFKIYDRFTVRLADRRAYQLDVFDVRFDHFKGVFGLRSRLHYYEISNFSKFSEFLKFFIIYFSKNAQTQIIFFSKK